MSGLYDEDGIDGPFDRAIKRAIKEDAKPTDFTVKYRRGALVNGQRGFDWEISDHRGFVVAGGWSAGKRPDAEQDAKVKLIELRAKVAERAA